MKRRKVQSNRSKDFLNLRIGGLLPDPETPKEGEKMYETLEWTVIVFLCGQGRGKKVIRPGPEYNSPPKEGDWACHPCCGTACAMRSAPLRKITDCERFMPAPL